MIDCKKDVKLSNEFKTVHEQMQDKLYKNVRLLCNVETRQKQIYVTLYNEKYFNYEYPYFDDHDLIYKVDNEDFYENFKKIRKIKRDYNNSYKPIKFKTEFECLKYLKSIGIDEVGPNN
jgi:hypothetical protein